MYYCTFTYTFSCFFMVHVGKHTISTLIIWDNVYYTLRIRLYVLRNGIITPTFLFKGWDWNPKTPILAREGSTGFLGIYIVTLCPFETRLVPFTRSSPARSPERFSSFFMHASLGHSTRIRKRYLATMARAGC